jgi:hypothetical protein
MGKVQSVAVPPHLMAAQSARVLLTPDLLHIRSSYPDSGRWLADFLPFTGDGGRCNSGMSQAAHCFALASIVANPQSDAKTTTLINVQIDVLLSL